MRIAQEVSSASRRYAVEGESNWDIESQEEPRSDCFEVSSNVSSSQLRTIAGGIIPLISGWDRPSRLTAVISI